MRRSYFTPWLGIVAPLATCLILVSEQLARAAQNLAEPPSSGRQQPIGITIYSAPDVESLTIGTLQPGEVTTPIAEVQGTGGSNWFLIKTKAGITGWIKESDSAEAKKAAVFFKSLPVENGSVAVSIPNVAAGMAPQGALLVPVLSLGRSSLVTVVFNHTTNGNLMLDTGATHTVISQRLAGLLSLKPNARATVQTVGGTVAVTVSRLRSLKVGEAEVNDLPVLIHDFSFDPRIEGLLGMDFLGRYRFGLDAGRQLLVLSPR